MKKLLKKILTPELLDIILSPLIFVSATVLSMVRKYGTHRMKLSKRILLKAGVFPIRDHFYEPLFNPEHLRKPLADDRRLPGIDFNVQAQLDLLSRFHFQDELAAFPLQKTDNLEFYYHNGCFEAGDAEYLYSIVRLLKPARIIEIGSGHSTLMATNAVKRIKKENPAYSCKHTCIEPYKVPWLEELDVEVIRNKVECCDIRMFSELAENDILFIDSSHIIRPQGDVLFECLEILPALKAGVYVHIHDIFSPRDYPDLWIKNYVRFWNEQYLLDAFLTLNREFKVMGAVNYLYHHHYECLTDKCPILRMEKNAEPVSFWIKRATN